MTFGGTPLDGTSYEIAYHFDLGGDTLHVHISAKKGTNVSTLLDQILLQAEILVAAEADVLHVAVGLSDEVVHLVGDDASDLELHRVEVIRIQGKLSFTGHGEEGSLVHDLHFLGNLRALQDQLRP